MRKDKRKTASGREEYKYIYNDNNKMKFLELELKEV